MYFLRVFPAIALGAVLAACSHHDSDTAPATPTPPPQFSADVTRTTHGVVHVKAADFRSLGYGLAYAYAQDNLCMFADSLLTVRGERSQYFGGEARATARKACSNSGWASAPQRACRRSRRRWTPSSACRG